MASILNLKETAINDNIPIMQDDSLNYISNFIKANDINTVLELGSGIGYSAIFLALNNDITITTLEKDKARYSKAIENIKDFKLDHKINIINADALTLDINNYYDLLIIDAAKTKNKELFIKYKPFIKKAIITDNINLNNVINKPLNKKKSILIKRTNEYKKFLKNYNTTYIEIGDTLALTSLDLMK